MGSTDTRGRELAEQGIGVGETSYPAGRNANAWLFCWWWLHHGAWGHGGILVPRPGIKPLPPALGACSLNHRTARKVSKCLAFCIMLFNPVPCEVGIIIIFGSTTCFVGF